MRIGIDFAFSAKNNLDLVALVGDDDNPEDLAYIGTVFCKSDEDILGFMRPYLVLGESVIDVDAPLVVPNRTGMRSCARMIGPKYRNKGVILILRIRRPTLVADTLEIPGKERGFNLCRTADGLTGKLRSLHSDLPACWVPVLFYLPTV